MAQSIVKTYKEITLILSEHEAVWLKEMMRDWNNPTMPEPVDGKKVREDLNKELERALKDWD